MKGTSSSPSAPLKSVWIVAAGSRGDIQPYVAVGAAFAKRGYHVTFLTFDKYAAMAETFGMKGVSLGQDYEANILLIDNIQQGMAQGDMMKAFAGIAEMNKKNAPTFFQAVLGEIKEHGVPNLCLVMPFAQYVAWYLWDHHKVPYLHITTYAAAYNPDHMLLGLPRLPFHLTYYLLHHLVIGGAYEQCRAYEKYLNAHVLDKFTKPSFIKYYKRPTLPMVTLLSHEIASVLYPPDVVSNSMWHFVGSTVIPKHDQVSNLDYFGGPQASKEIEAFLAGGTKPVYLGWGSMICISAEHMVELCIRAVHHAGVRAIVLGGAAGLSLDQVQLSSSKEDQAVLEHAKTNILFVDYAPHEWLFPRVAATVHHGGAGTMTAALRGGVPTIITPVFGDQYDFSYAVNQLGVGIGFSKQFHKIHWKELGDAIATVTSKSNTDIIERAARLGETLQGEDGANNAVDEAERYWKEYCANGQFHEHVPCVDPEEEKKKRRSQLKKAIAVVSVAASAFYAVNVFRKRT